MSGLSKANPLNIHDYKHAHTEDVNLNTFGVKEIHDIFERVLDYGDISIFEVSFSFWINPLSLKEGI
jgi:hypothetical protein